MAIPLEILKIWSKQGKSDNSKITYESIKNLIEKEVGYNYDIFLQGSYHNSTHVKENSDIDIVIINKNLTINNSALRLSGDIGELQNFKLRLFYHIQHKNNFAFELGNKTIKYAGNNYYVEADIVPCGYYRDYSSFQVGTIIYDTSLKKYFINYPKQHYSNGVQKSNITHDNFKKTVRMFKNARNHAVKKHILSSEDIAPSYFLECLIYNVPNIYFSGNESSIFVNVLKWLNNNKNNLANLKCQNGIQKLFGNPDTNSVTYNKWNTANAITFINKITYLWNNWSEI